MCKFLQDKLQVEVLSLVIPSAQWCVDQNDADIILTTLTSEYRIRRYLKNYKIPVVSNDWLKECSQQRKRLPLNKYKVNFPRMTENSSSGSSSKDTKESRSSSSSEDINTSRSSPKTTIQEVQKSLEEREQVITADALHKKFSHMPPGELPPDDRNCDEDDCFVEIKKEGSSQATTSDLTLKEEKKSLKKSTSTNFPKEFNNSRYACLRETPLEAYRNRRLVFLLQLLEKKRSLLEMSEMRALAYHRAWAAIKAYPRNITSATEAQKITGIGVKIGGLIRIYLETGTIPEAECLLSDEKFRTLSHFCKVFGVGPSTANIWWDKGYRSLQEVLDCAKPPESIQLAIELLSEFDQLMDRKDVEEIIEIIILAATHLDEGAIVTPVGGYRRGKEQNADVDIVVSWSDSEKHKDGLFLRDIVEYLEKEDYLKHSLLISDRRTNYYGRLQTTGGANMEKLDTCYCAFMQPSKQVLRQVDIVVATPDQYAAAVLAWTGSRQFERDLRDYAKKEKRLSVKGHAIFKENSEKPLTIKSEEDAFELLGIPYIKPNMRNC
ncbi:hypothetical protein BDC45DRAFT_584115 [Circinella umbellata]|nr:hypothetical protein BDC45DRAFT_584115 [Circinella umbellata]